MVASISRLRSNDALAASVHALPALPAGAPSGRRRRRRRPAPGSTGVAAAHRSPARPTVDERAGCRRPVPCRPRGTTTRPAPTDLRCRPVPWPGASTCRKSKADTSEQAMPARDTPMTWAWRRSSRPSDGRPPPAAMFHVKHERSRHRSFGHPNGRGNENGARRRRHE
jgi:hypothetical protein